jgi:hypothetical protein
LRVLAVQVCVCGARDVLVTREEGEGVVGHTQRSELAEQRANRVVDLRDGVIKWPRRRAGISTASVLAVGRDALRGGVHMAKGKVHKEARGAVAAYEAARMLEQPSGEQPQVGRLLDDLGGVARALLVDERQREERAKAAPEARVGFGGGSGRGGRRVRCGGGAVAAG